MEEGVAGSLRESSKPVRHPPQLTSRAEPAQDAVRAPRIGSGTQRLSRLHRRAARVGTPGRSWARHRVGSRRARSTQPSSQRCPRSAGVAGRAPHRRRGRRSRPVRLARDRASRVSQRCLPLGFDPAAVPLRRGERAALRDHLDRRHIRLGRGSARAAWSRSDLHLPAQLPRVAEEQAVESVPFRPHRLQRDSCRVRQAGESLEARDPTRSPRRSQRSNRLRRATRRRGRLRRGLDRRRSALWACSSYARAVGLVLATRRW